MAELTSSTEKRHTGNYSETLCPVFSNRALFGFESFRQSVIYYKDAALGAGIGITAAIIAYNMLKQKGLKKAGIVTGIAIGADLVTHSILGAKSTSEARNRYCN